MRELLDKARAEICEGMALAKCRKCGCMRDALDELERSIGLFEPSERDAISHELETSLSELDEQEYGCAGCSYCYGAVAANILRDAADQSELVSETGSATSTSVGWPPVPGEYVVLGEGSRFPVAISTLGTESLAEELTQARPFGVSIIGKTETENIGIDKLIANTISNPSLRFLILAGEDPPGHLTGQTLLALAADGVDERMRIIGAEGRRPILKNSSHAEVERFRRQVDVIDMIGTVDVDAIIDRAAELSLSGTGCATCEPGPTFDASQSIEPIVAKPSSSGKLDDAGYFVIIPQPELGRIILEHYANDDRLLHVVEGTDARSIYLTAIQGEWLTQMSHAAYLGKELQKAELSMIHGFKYVQDGM